MTAPAKMLTVQEVADLLRIDPSHVTRLTHKGVIPAVDLGSKKRAYFRYHPEEIAEFQRKITFLGRVHKNDRELGRVAR